MSAPMRAEAIRTKAPRPSRCRTRIDELGSRLELRSARLSAGHGCAVAFIAAWQAGWSAGCVMLLANAAADPSPMNVLIAIPFVTAWFVISGVLASLLFGYQRLRLDPQGLHYEFHAVVPLRRRHVPLEQLKQAVPAIGRATSQSSAWACLRIETVGKPVDFGSDLDPEELHWLVQRVNQRLDGLKPRRIIIGDRSLDAESLQDERQRPESGAETLVLAARPLVPLSDCRYMLESDIEELRFVRAGRRSLATIGGLTFINLFWNGIVSVFVLEFVRDFRWLMFFFPFEAIGLAMFGAWVLALAAPAWRERWRFGRDEIAHRWSLFGLSWTRRYRTEPFDRIELNMRSTLSGASRQSAVSVLTETGGDYLLSFISRDERIALQIKSLTEGEARWIADQVLRARPECFAACGAADRTANTNLAKLEPEHRANGAGTLL